FPGSTTVPHRIVALRHNATLSLRLSDCSSQFHRSTELYYRNNKCKNIRMIENDIQ
ncbi:hypothetical protein PIB30_065039, partial [Stylosanthes scabra]|nr:hypothetical protein [Stylosanthes scabra]